MTKQRSASIWDTGYTNTTLFLFPVFQIDDKELAANGFKNAFLADKNKHHGSENKLIYALFRPTNSLAFSKLLDKLEEKGLIFDEYDYEDKHVVLALIFPKDFEDDYRTVVLGKYSRCSEAFKKLFPKTGELKNADGTTKYVNTIAEHVFTRSQEFQDEMEIEFNINISDLGNDFECWGACDMDKETLSISELLSKV